MRVRTRHLWLAAVACKVYGLTLHLYPVRFRRAFGEELAVTFRSHVEDVLDSGACLSGSGSPCRWRSTMSRRHLGMRTWGLVVAAFSPSRLAGQSDILDGGLASLADGKRLNASKVLAS